MVGMVPVAAALAGCVMWNTLMPPDGTGIFKPQREGQVIMQMQLRPWSPQDADPADPANKFVQLLWWECLPPQPERTAADPRKHR